MCALLMSKYLNWKVKGFYDGKVLLFQKDVVPKDCVFLDMEIALNLKKRRSTSNYTLSRCV